jgi:hypothetical protein
MSSVNQAAEVLEWRKVAQPDICTRSGFSRSPPGLLADAALLIVVPREGLFGIRVRRTASPDPASVFAVARSVVTHSSLAGGPRVVMNFDHRSPTGS